MIRNPVRFTALAILAGLFLCSPAMAEKTSAEVVKATATADKPDADGKQTVTITLVIDKPFHIYANPIDNKDMVREQTELKITAAKPAKVAVNFPAGKVQKDTVLGDYKIWEGTVTIKADVVRAAGDTGPLAIELTVNACTDKLCLQSGTIKLEVK